LGRYILGVAKPSRPDKRRVEGGGRVTPKGGPTKSRGSGSSAPEASTRYTPPIPTAAKISSPIVPVFMFGFLGLGIAMIMFNYFQVLPGSVSNWYLFGGLGLILAGIITATQYH
jgi:hypothetical protein